MPAVDDDSLVINQNIGGKGLHIVKFGDFAPLVQVLRPVHFFGFDEGPEFAFLIVSAQSHDDEGVFFHLAAQPPQVRHRIAAGPAPSGPKIQ